MINIFFSNIENNKEWHGIVLQHFADNPIFRFIAISRKYNYKESGSNLYFINRKNECVKDFISCHPGKNIIIGTEEQDLFTASNNKWLLIYPEWVNQLSNNKAKTYGVHVSTLDQLIQLIEIFINQSGFFYKLDVDNQSTVYALTRANNYNVPIEEDTLVSNFRKTLKDDYPKYLDAIKMTILSGISDTELLMNSNIWTIMPSSGTKLNKTMQKIKEQCRFLTSKRFDTIQNPLLIRHSQTMKSHYTNKQNRLSIGAAKHLNSIYLNPYYKDKIYGKTVTVLDDYITNGISFESIRNLLINAGASHVNFVAIGRFTSSDNDYKGIYQLENYEITGDIYTPNYSFNLIYRKDIGYKADINYAARESFIKLYNILNESY